VSELSPVERQERRRRRRRQELIRWGIRAAILVLVFVLGIALGEAIHDNPNPGSTITVERTLHLPASGGSSTVTP
jgi:hypothetical protein